MDMITVNSSRGHCEDSESYSVKLLGPCLAQSKGQILAVNVINSRYANMLIFRVFENVFCNSFTGPFLDS